MISFREKMGKCEERRGKGHRCRLRRRFVSYASGAGGLAHVRSVRARKQTAEIPGQARNDGEGVGRHLCHITVTSFITIPKCENRTKTCCFLLAKNELFENSFSSHITVTSFGAYCYFLVKSPLRPKRNIFFGTFYSTFNQLCVFGI